MMGSISNPESKECSCKQIMIVHEQNIKSCLHRGGTASTFGPLRWWGPIMDATSLYFPSAFSDWAQFTKAFFGLKNLSFYFSNNTGAWIRSSSHKNVIFNLSTLTVCTYTASRRVSLEAEWSHICSPKCKQTCGKSARAQKAPNCKWPLWQPIAAITWSCSQL